MDYMGKIIVFFWYDQVLLSNIHSYKFSLLARHLVRQHCSASLQVTYDHVYTFLQERILRGGAMKLGLWWWVCKCMHLSKLYTKKRVNVLMQI